MSGWRRYGLGSVGLAVATSLSSACLWSDLDAVIAGPSVTDAAIEDGPSPVDTGASPTDSDVAEAAPPDTGPPPPPPTAPCMPTQSPVQEWTFDTGLQGWGTVTDTGVSATVAWSKTMGQPTAGAIDFAVSPGDGGNQGAWLHLSSAYGDLSSRTIAAWVWLDGGASPHIKLYVQSGSQYVWADGGTIAITPRTWTCLSLDVASPVYNGPGYDPTDIITIGFETMAVDSFNLFVDTVQYY